MIKRGFDLVVAGIGLLCSLPAVAIIAVAIKIGDGGCVWFRQIRIGRLGQPFTILKFRTMREQMAPEGREVTVAGDLRVTRVGRLLRRLKLDELPQLLNVLRGEMSLVGPRPEVPRYVALYTPEQRAVLDLKPGITDEASIAFRDEEALLAAASDPERFYVEHCIPRKIRINLDYASKASVIRDLGVILRTIRRVWLDKSH